MYYVHKEREMDKNMKIAVIGAGAIGGIAAAFISRAGYDVEAVCKYDEITKKTGEGIDIKGVRGELKIPVKAVKDIDGLGGKKDIIIVATKAYDMPGACEKALRFADENTLFVSMQNGICTDAMARVVGKNRTVGCVVGFGATMAAPAELDMTSQGTFIIGMEGGESSRLAGLKEVLETVVPTTISENILSDLYSKLIVNSCISTLGVICGMTLGDMMKVKKIRDIFLKIMAEALAVARKMDLYVPPYAGKLDYYKLLGSTGPLAELKRHLTIRVVGIKYKNLKSSSLQSLKRGRPTEIDYFNGYIARKGDEAGVDTPVNDAVTQMVKEIELKKRDISIRNFDEKVFREI
jgi:2-dehydropantoate 2-reductase